MGCETPDIKKCEKAMTAFKEKLQLKWYSLLPNGSVLGTILGGSSVLLN